MNKYKVTQEFMYELEAWKRKWENDCISVNSYLFDTDIDVIERWRFMHFSTSEMNKRYGAIVNWINGEDVFEIGTPKYIVKLKDVVPTYIRIEKNGYFQVTYRFKEATKFDDFAKASEWANAHFEVVEVDE